MWMNILVVSAAFLTLVLPVLADMKKNGRLTIPGFLFLFFAIVALLGGAWQVRQSARDAESASNNAARIMGKIEQEALRLRPDDFQLRLWSTTESKAPRGPGFQQQAIYTWGDLGKARLVFQFVPTTYPQVVRFMRPGPTLLRYSLRICPSRDWSTIRT